MPVCMMKGMAGHGVKVCVGRRQRCPLVFPPRGKLNGRVPGERHVPVDVEGGRRHYNGVHFGGRPVVCLANIGSGDFDFSGEGIPAGTLESLSPQDLQEAETKADAFMQRMGAEEGEPGVGVLLERRRRPPPEQTEELVALQGMVRDKVGLIMAAQDMSLGEVKLTVGVEIQDEREDREGLDVDDPASVTPDEMAAALMEVMDGGEVSDALALQVLWLDLKEWPVAEKKEKEKGKKDIKGEGITLENTLEWVPLYVISAFPVIIGVAAVLTLFYNSLQAG